MVTRRLDRALEAISECRARTPDLKAAFSQGTPQVEALNALLAALDLADRALRTPRPAPGQG